MTERPIIMSGRNPKLILDGRKTQTRRIVKPQRYWGGELMALWKCESCTDSWIWNAPDYPDGKEDEITCPYGVAGDRLWVKTVHWRGAKGTPNEQIWDEFTRINRWKIGREFTDGSLVLDDNGKHVLLKRKPSIHMPRWASRITLEITKVRVERLQDISEEDAIAEGIGAGFVMNGGWPDYQHIDKTGMCTLTQDSARMSYATFWVHGKGAWEKNPWVWVLEFKRI